MRKASFLSGMGLGLLLAATVVQADDGRSSVIERTFRAAAGGQLVIEADRGSVTLEGADTEEVRIEVTRQVTRGSDEKAAEMLKRHEVRFREDQGIIRLETELRGKDSWNWRGPQLEVSIRAILPREFNIDCRTAGGSIRVGQVKGTVAVRTAGGSLSLESLEGAISGKTSGGSIRAMQLKGTSDLSTAGGSIAVDGMSGKTLKVATSGGSIKLVGIQVPAEARTAGGGIDIETASGPLLASTSGGSITARFLEVPKEEVSLKTSGGGITLVLPEQAAFHLDASTSAGSVKSDFPVLVTRSGDEARSSLVGPVNGGGPVFTLRTSAGSIRVKKS